MRGFTVYFAVLIASLSLALGLTVVDLLTRELALSQVATQSQLAIYAADTGSECALYWDSKYSDADGSYFPTSTASSMPSPGSNILCANKDISASDAGTTLELAANAATTTFTLNLGSTQASPCVVVTIGKSGAVSEQRTVVTSQGRNTCAAGTLRVERTLRVSY